MKAVVYHGPRQVSVDEVPDAKHGQAPPGFGLMWFKGQHMGSGQCPVKRREEGWTKVVLHPGQAA